MTAPHTALVLLSGGMDSTALASELVYGHGATNVQAIGIHYGQRHATELTSAARVAHRLNIRYDVIDLSVLAKSLNSALTGSGTPVPEGHYAADNMAATVVPNRNAIMLMVAVGVAASRGLEAVYTAVHAGDHPIYPDCRPEFVEAANEAAQLGTAGMGDVEIRAPFVDISKADIVTRGTAVGAPFHLTWSCYQGGAEHCGKCGTCVERAEAFHLAGVPDPTRYEDTTFWLSAVAAANA